MASAQNEVKPRVFDLVCGEEQRLVQDEALAGHPFQIHIKQIELGRTFALQAKRAIRARRKLDHHLVRLQLLGMNASRPWLNKKHRLIFLIPLWYKSETKCGKHESIGLWIHFRNRQGEKTIVVGRIPSDRFAILLVLLLAKLHTEAERPRPLDVQDRFRCEDRRLAALKREANKLSVLIENRLKRCLIFDHQLNISLGRIDH
mmetsp:Transcript_10280/g.17631  ORF Transcript_10280/g.17631 Transcript_10280/m.17631 type:complete len:203 (+) Transcript_10280:1101-1709(+)